MNFFVKTALCATSATIDSIVTGSVTNTVANAVNATPENKEKIVRCSSFISYVVVFNTVWKLNSDQQ